MLMIFAIAEFFKYYITLAAHSLVILITIGIGNIYLRL